MAGAGGLVEGGEEGGEGGREDAVVGVGAGERKMPV